MIYNKDDLNGVKGRIGELIFQNFIYYKYLIDGIENDELQKVGVDLVLPLLDVCGQQFLDLKVDVKLSDKLGDIFSMFYSNGSNIRHPFVPTNQADRIAVVQYNWNLYQKENATNKTFDQLCEKLKDYVEQENLDKLVDDINKKRNSLELLRELYIGHRTIDRLQKERKERLTSTFEDTKKLVERYILSIKLIQTSRIKEICSPFPNMQVGWMITDNNGQMISKKAMYGKNIAAEISFDAIEKYCKVLHESEQAKQVAIVDICEQLVKVTNKESGYKLTSWPFRLGGFIQIDCKDKLLKDMKKEDLKWILSESENRKSTLWKMGLKSVDWSKQQFVQYVESLLEKS